MISHRNSISNIGNQRTHVQYQHVIRIRDSSSRTTATTTAAAGGIQTQFPPPHSFRSSSSSSDDQPNEFTKTTYSRRSHRKSRYGCRNCKNRRLKPQNARSQSSTSPSAVEVVGSMSPDMTGTDMSLVAIERSITHLIGSKDIATALCVDGSSLTNLRFLNHFVNGSTASILNPKIKVVMQTGLIRSAFMSAHLMHAILAAACLHLNRMQPGNKTRELREIYHFQRAIQLYQTELTRTNTKNVNTETTASLIGSCLLLAINDFCPAGFKSEHSWVFTSNPADLNWLALQGGLRCILQITRPFLGASIWGPAFQEAHNELKSFQEEQPGRSGLHFELADLCCIGDFTTAETNPYHWSVQLLSRMLTLKPYNRPENYSAFVSWMGQIRPEFITLLRAKDERALLIFSWWMALMCALSSFQVWIYGRIIPECKAICQYLESTSTDPHILRLMEWPARACGFYDFTPETFEDVTFGSPPNFHRQHCAGFFGC
uniref:Sterol regulatory element-binding protein ECM22 n=1 Tax=Talaromyces marneffei PM1 TaxID=1077442 RepID=A0A093V207_TALMA